MKKTVLCCAIALVFLFGLSATMVEAQKFDDMWFKAKIKGSLQFGDAQGEIAKEKGKDTAYLYISYVDVQTPCGGYIYNVEIVAETADDVWEEIGGGIVYTCAADETGFWATLAWTIDGIAFSILSDGIVSGDPTIKSKGCVIFAQDGTDPTGDGLPVGIGKKCKIKAPDIDCDKLPFDQEALGFPACPVVP